MTDLISREVKVTREEWMAYNEWGASSNLTRGACPITEAQIARVKQLRESESEKEQDELVKKAVADALEEVAKIVNENIKSLEISKSKLLDDAEIYNYYENDICTLKPIEDAIRALIKRNSKEA